MKQAKISKAELCDSYGNSVRVDFENGDCMFLYGDTNLTSFIVQAFSINGANYNSCDTEEIRRLVDYVADVINDDSNETHALFRDLIKIYLDFSHIKGKDKSHEH